GKLGTPNACNQCHAKENSDWAAQKIAQWFPNQQRKPQFGEIIEASRHYQENFESKLLQLGEDNNNPNIVRATALAELRNYLGPRSLNALTTMIKDPDPEIRLASLQALEGADSKTRVTLAIPLLKDPLRGIRIRAVGLLSGIPRNEFSPEQQN